MSKKVNEMQDLFSAVELEEKSVAKKSNKKILVDDKENLNSEDKIFNKNTEKKSDIMAQKEYKTHSVEEVKEATIKYFGGDQLAADVWMNKYALKDSDGNIFELTPDDMHHRIASEIARIENRYPNPMSEEEVFEDCKTRLPERLWETAKKVYYSWPYNIPEIEGMRALIQKIKDKYGKSVFLLSNISKYFVSCAHEVPILRLIDNCIFSSVCKKVKPNQEIFEHLCNEYNILPSETLFIDDLQKNIDGAKKCGINGYVFDGDVQKLERYIDELFQ